MLVSTTKIKKCTWALLADESGQSTTEYVLLLLFVVVAVKAVGGQLKQRITGILEKAFGKTESAIESADTGN